MIHYFPEINKCIVIHATDVQQIWLPMARSMPVGESKQMIVVLPKNGVRFCILSPRTGRILTLQASILGILRNLGVKIELSFSPSARHKFDIMRVQFF